MVPPIAHENSARARESRDKDEERADAQLEKVPSLGVAPNLYRPEVDTSAVDHRKLKRKIDLQLLPWLALLYLMSFLDRGNIGNARLYDLQTSLHITDRQYLIALTVFFFPYALFEVPSNLAMCYLRPSRWIPFIIFAWGVTMLFHGLARNYGDLIGLRCLLGVAEAGLYPGIVFYLSCWYKRSEIGLRIAIFFSAATLAGAFGGLLAAALHNMNGIAGRPGWAWIFIVEGSMTILVACASPWIIQDFPETAKFLTETERVYIIRGLKADQRFSAGGEKFKLKYLRQCLTDWKTYVTMGICIGTGGPLYAFALFIPTIIHQLGFKATAANLLVVPPYALGCLVTLAVGIVGDRVGHRGYITLGLFGTAFVGYMILAVSRSAALSYFAVFLAAASLFPVIPITQAWISSNIEGSYKRGTVVAIIFTVGNLNGAVTSNVYRARYQPWYTLGHWIVLAYIAVGWLSALTYTVFLRRENEVRDRGERDEVIDGISNPNAKLHNGRYGSVTEARIEKGDTWSGFRYTV
ncbi:MFS general substrate transporter [Russula brevipes]|nr:MFS general substrate transporter [Russula brevipes]